MPTATDDRALLALWEQALAQPVARRGEALLPDTAACTLGERNARLAMLHAQVFGAGIDLLSHCPACGAAAQFSGDCAQLMQAATPADAAVVHQASLLGHEVEFRLPLAGDLAAAASVETDEFFARRLMEACVLRCSRDGQALPPAELPLAVLDAVSQRMEALDPTASISFALTCPHCAAPWEARLDLAQLVWQKLQALVEGLLLDVDTLARRYGWNEQEVLSLSRTRRAAYVQLASSA